MVALYPSISVDMALKAMAHAFEEDTLHPPKTKEAVQSFSELILKESFVVFEDNVYEAKEGIPTGNCISTSVGR